MDLQSKYIAETITIFSQNAMYIFFLQNIWLFRHWLLRFTHVKLLFIKYIWIKNQCQILSLYFYFKKNYNKFVIVKEWGWTARNSIARQSFARHFWQEINCSTQNLSTARIQLILAKLDSSKWQKSDNFLHASICCNSKM